jgi:hypothetical protein
MSEDNTLDKSSVKSDNMTSKSNVKREKYV